jgi:hypothetical protein
VLGAALEHAVRALDSLMPDASRVRGEAREELLQRLASIEDELTVAALAALDDRQRRVLEDEADSELSPFKPRMTGEAYRQSRLQAVKRLVRQRFGLPSVSS